MDRHHHEDIFHSEGGQSRKQKVIVITNAKVFLSLYRISTDYAEPTFMKFNYYTKSTIRI